MLPVLSHLTSVAITEDTYSTIQKDILQILEVLLTFLSTIEESQAEIDAMYKVQPLASDEVEKMRKEVGKRVVIKIEVGKAGEMLADILAGMFCFT